MIAKKVVIFRKDAGIIVFTGITQLYTMGNFLVVAGDSVGEPGKSVVFNTNKYRLEELQNMDVEF